MTLTEKETFHLVTTAQESVIMYVPYDTAILYLDPHDDYHIAVSVSFVWGVGLGKLVIRSDELTEQRPQT